MLWIENTVLLVGDTSLRTMPLFSMSSMASLATDDLRFALSAMSLRVSAPEAIAASTLVLFRRAMGSEPSMLSISSRNTAMWPKKWVLMASPGSPWNRCWYAGVPPTTLYAINCWSGV